jgi:hypothetical protein
MSGYTVRSGLGKLSSQLGFNGDEKKQLPVM